MESGVSKHHFRLAVVRLFDHAGADSGRARVEIPLHIAVAGARRGGRQAVRRTVLALFAVMALFLTFVAPVAARPPTQEPAGFGAISFAAMEVCDFPVLLEHDSKAKTITFDRGMDSSARTSPAACGHDHQPLDRGLDRAEDLRSRPADDH